MPGSSSTPPPPADREKEIEAIAEAYLDGLQKGEKPDREALLQAHPSIAELLERRLILVEMMYKARWNKGGEGTKPLETSEDASLKGDPSSPESPGDLQAEDGEDVLEPPDQLGPFKILERIGQGGMGNVYLADQEEPIRRRVALKVMRPGFDTEDTMARFETERQALALMNHPNIAKVFDAGVTGGGRPYFVMEHVPGRSLTRYCDENRLSTTERLELFIKVCEAVQHAHQKGVIHRDLKPSNILVTATNGHGSPKIIDFGIAKATGQRLAEHLAYTEHGRVIGTPEYMSPEQADPLSRDEDTRSDIYTLGIVLYELLVGALPFDSTRQRKPGLDEFRRQLLEEEPPKPSTRISTLGRRSTSIAKCRRTTSLSLRRILRGDLDWITMKALEKDRTRRYQGASEFAADIRRYMNHEPVLAGPPGLRYRLGKLARRHRAAVALSTSMVVLILAGIVGLYSLYLQAVREREGKEAEARKAETLLGLIQEMLRPEDPSSQGGYKEIRLADILDRTSRKIYENPPEDLEIRAEFHRILGRTYRWLGQYSDAGDHVAAAYKIYEDNFGFDSVHSLQVKLDWAIILDRLGNSRAAGQLFGEVYEKRREILDPSDPLIFDGARAVAINLRVQRRMEECREFSERAVEECRLQLGPDHEATGHLLFTLGIALRELGELDESMAVTREVLRIYDLRLEDDEAQHVRARHGLAALHLRRGEVDECRSIMEEVLPIQERRHGEDHPIALAARTLWARAQLARGDGESAVEALSTVLEVYAERDEHRQRGALVARHHLARAQSALGAGDAAETTLREGIELGGVTTGSDYPSILLANDLGGLLLERGGLREAVPLLTSAWEKAAESPYLTVGEIAGAGGTWGACLARLGRGDEAGTLLKDALVSIDSRRAGEMGQAALVLDGLLRLSESEGDEEGAARYRGRLEDLAR